MKSNKEGNRGWGPSMSFGFKIVGVAGLAQLTMWLLIGATELVGLADFQRAALAVLEDFYAPAFSFFRWIIPEDWQTLGNILLGIAGIAFCVIIYSVACGIIGVMAHMCRRVLSR